MTKFRIFRSVAVSFVAVLLLISVPRAQAQSEVLPEPEAESTTQLETIRVTGMQAEELSQSTAPKRISKETLEEARLTDVGRALRQAPGVYVRDEEGQGLRPNIGLRGTNPDRSKKIVLMQDEILSGPAPYSAPAAYYTPPLNFAEQLEIYKGFSAVPYGPNSIGGAINYISRSVPPKLTGSFDFGAGSFGSTNTKLLFGNKTSWGGFVLEGSRISSDGFKKIDSGEPAGFFRNDVAAKFRFDLPSVDSKIQYVEARLGYGNEDSHESYLGLADEDFERDPYRRYSSSSRDEMKWTHSQVELEYNRQIGESGLWKVAVYRHDFARVWYRLDRFGDASKNFKGILKDPTGADALYAGVLRGTQDSSAVGGTLGQLIMARNDRTFISQGVQTGISGDINWGDTLHQLKLTARVHQDQIDRTHTFDTFNMTGGRLELINDHQIDKLNREWALATTVSVQDDISWDQNVVTLLGRGESIQYKVLDKPSAVEKNRSDSYFVPGIGYLRKITENFSVKTSVNKAVTAAGLDAMGAEKREESTNYELGLKYLNDRRTLEGDLIFFYNDYANITGTCTASTSCNAAQLDQQYNGGKASVAGLEARVAHSFQGLGPWARSAWFPVQLNATLIRAQFESEFESNNQEWGTDPLDKTIRAGDPLPYIPSLQYTLVLGHEQGKFKQAFNILYQGAMFDQSLQKNRTTIPAFGIVDWNGLYNWSDSLQVFAKAENLLKREYLVAERPLGARPGKPQSFMVGLKASF